MASDNSTSGIEHYCPDRGETVQMSTLNCEFCGDSVREVLGK